MRRYMYFNWLMSGKGIGISGMLSFMFVRLFVAVTIILVLAFVYKSGRQTLHKHTNGSFSQQTSDLLSLLNERLVKGEITIEEYQKLKTELLSK